MGWIRRRPDRSISTADEQIDDVEPADPTYDELAPVGSGTSTYEEPDIHQPAIYDGVRGPTDDNSLPTIANVDHNTFA